MEWDASEMARELLPSAWWWGGVRAVTYMNQAIQANCRNTLDSKHAYGVCKITEILESAVTYMGHGTAEVQVYPLSALILFCCCHLHEP